MADPCMSKSDIHGTCSLHILQAIDRNGAINKFSIFVKRLWGLNQIMYEHFKKYLSHDKCSVKAVVVFNVSVRFLNSMAWLPSLLFSRYVILSWCLQLLCPRTNMEPRLWNRNQLFTSFGSLVYSLTLSIKDRVYWKFPIRHSGTGTPLSNSF